MPVRLPFSYGDFGVFAVENIAIIERYEYDPYGNVRIFKGYDSSEGHEDMTVTGNSLVDNPIFFAGYYFDNETGLYYVRHRMYSPTLQRWLQRDPLSFLNLEGVPGPAAYTSNLGCSAVDNWCCDAPRISGRLHFGLCWWESLNTFANPLQYVGGDPVGQPDPMVLRRIESTPELCLQRYNEMRRGCVEALEQCLTPMVPPVSLEAVVGAVIAGLGAPVEGAICGIAGMPFVWEHIKECAKDFSDCSSQARFLFDVCMKIAMGASGKNVALLREEPT